jgi:hypothetical protein
MKRAIAFAAVLLVALALQGMAVAQSATVMTDQSDYAPGQIVTITGSGWQPGETVTLQLVESPLIDTHPDLSAVADADGNIFNNEFSPDQHDLNITFALTATGNTSGLQAQTTFTDASHILTVVAGAQSPTAVAPGGTAATYAISFTSNGSGADPVTLSVTSGLPAGASASFSPNPVDVSATSTLTITTTGSTPTGTFTFTIQAVADATKTTTATLLVSTPTKVQVETAAVGGGTVVPAQSVLSGNSITVYAIERDASNRFMGNVAATWSLTSITGAVVASNLVPSGDTKSATFTGNAAGSATIHAVVSGLTSVDSGTITVPVHVGRRGQIIIATLSRKDRYTVVTLQ